jgi:tetratricopeptide (TPR) repeat protein
MKKDFKFAVYGLKLTADYIIKKIDSAAMVRPQIDNQDLELLLNHQGLKNLGDFPVRSRLSKMKRKFEALIQSDAVSAYQNLGVLSAYQTHYTDAVEYFKKALALSPNDEFILLNYANALGLTGLHQDALPLCFRALEINPLNFLAFQRANQMSDLYLFPEDVERSFEMYKNNDLQVDGQYIKKSDTSRNVMNFLQKNKVGISTYRAHLNLAIKVYYFHNNVNYLHRSTEKNEEGNYLSTVFYVPDASVEHIALLNSEFEKQVIAWLHEQPDGGFDLADELEGSIIYFTAQASA